MKWRGYFKHKTIGKYKFETMEKNSNKQPREIVLNTLRYRTGEREQRSEDLQNGQCRLYKGAGEITLEREKMYIKTEYQNKTIQ